MCEVMVFGRWMDSKSQQAAENGKGGELGFAKRTEFQGKEKWEEEYVTDVIDSCTGYYMNIRKILHQETKSGFKKRYSITATFEKTLIHIL